MAKKCRKIKYNKRDAEKQADFWMKRYSNAMVAYQCKKCAGAPWHIANADSYIPKVMQYLRRKEEVAE